MLRTVNRGAVKRGGAVVSARAAVVAVMLIVLGLPGTAYAQGFDEQFTSPVLGPAWTVVPGVRIASGFPPPANDFSLTANPGHLRYTLNAMTHGDGFVNGYQPTFGEHSCCTHDPGLELHRTFGGTDWVLETKVSYHMPFANGRQLDLRVYFGDGGPGTFFVRLQRGRDVHPINWLSLQLVEQTGTTVSTLTSREYTQVDLPGFDGTDSTHWFRVERAGGVVTAMWSDDGLIWNTAWSHDLGTALDGLDQRVVITGLSWRVPAGSYADYDYITVTPTVVPVDIDIKPGSDPNSVNPRSKGVIPVAILTAASFDATTVDPLSVAFGPAGAGEAHGMGHVEDVDGDGDNDLVLHFRVQDTGIACGATSATLTGETFGGQTIEGTDAVNTVGCT